MKRVLMAMTLACVLSGTALAGEMPGVNHSSVYGGVSTVGSTTPTTGTTAPGEMPGVDSGNPTSTESSVIVTVLLSIISLIGR